MNRSQCPELFASLHFSEFPIRPETELSSMVQLPCNIEIPKFAEKEQKKCQETNLSIYVS